jgi:hypothetical protein
MKLSPPRTYRPKPHALIVPGTRTMRVHTVWGTTDVEGRRDVTAALAQLAGHVVYVTGGLESLKHVTGASEWVLSTWRHRETSMTHVPSGVKVTSLRGALTDDDDPFASLSEFLCWLAEYGVAPASLSAMSWRLLEASLSGTVTIGFDPAVGRAAFYGGRQEVRLNREDRPSVYRSQKLLDVRGAYPHAMAARPIALSLREVSRETSLSDEPGLCEATVRVPAEMPYAPLPVRVAPDAIMFQYGRVRGTWPWCEVAAAQALDCEVTVHRSWAPRREADLFARWWQMAREGRDLARPGAVQLAKATSVCLWGQFAMTGDERSEVRWTDDAGEHAYTVDRDARSMPHAWTAHVAAEVAARVRTQTLVEGLYGLSATPVHVDTDGVIVRASATMGSNFGEGFGQWRCKTKMHEVQIRAPQFYRWTCGCMACVPKAKYHYCASGMTPDAARHLFARGGRPTRISYLAREDACLPSAWSQDHERIAMLLAEARTLGVGR